MNNGDNSEYDNISLRYTNDTETRGDRACILVPTARQYLENLDDKNVLELACGSGFFTRLIKKWGAESVLGVDLSDQMISLAKEQELKDQLGIQYLVSNAATLLHINDFDLVFAAFLLHYSESISKLRQMCQSISSNLALGGRFLTFVENPKNPLYEGIKYDVSVVAHGPVNDGTRITRTHYENDQPKFSFDHYHYEIGVYEECLFQAGFENIQWLKFIKGSNADIGYPLNYWDDYINNGSIIVLSCEKRG